MSDHFGLNGYPSAPHPILAVALSLSESSAEHPERVPGGQSRLEADGMEGC